MPGKRKPPRSAAKRRQRKANKQKQSQTEEPTAKATSTQKIVAAIRRESALPAAIRLTSEDADLIKHMRAQVPSSQKGYVFYRDGGPYYMLDLQTQESILIDFTQLQTLDALKLWALFDCLEQQDPDYLDQETNRHKWSISEVLLQKHNSGNATLAPDRVIVLYQRRGRLAFLNKQYKAALAYCDIVLQRYIEYGETNNLGLYLAHRNTISALAHGAKTGQLTLDIPKTITHIKELKTLLKKIDWRSAETKRSFIALIMTMSVLSNACIRQIESLLVQERTRSKLHDHHCRRIDKEVKYIFQHSKTPNLKKIARLLTTKLNLINKRLHGLNAAIELAQNNITILQLTKQLITLLGGTQLSGADTLNAEERNNIDITIARIDTHIKLYQAVTEKLRSGGTFTHCRKNKMLCEELLTSTQCHIASQTEERSKQRQEYQKTFDTLLKQFDTKRTKPLSSSKRTTATLASSSSSSAAGSTSTGSVPSLETLEADVAKLTNPIDTYFTPLSTPIHKALNAFQRNKTTMAPTTKLQEIGTQFRLQKVDMLMALREQLGFVIPASMCHPSALEFNFDGLLAQALTMPGPQKVFKIIVEGKTTAADPTLLIDRLWGLTLSFCGMVEAQLAQAHITLQQTKFKVPKLAISSLYNFSQHLNDARDNLARAQTWINLLADIAHHFELPNNALACQSRALSQTLLEHQDFLFFSINEQLGAALTQINNVKRQQEAQRDAARAHYRRLGKHWCNGKPLDQQSHAAHYRIQLGRTATQLLEFQSALATQQAPSTATTPSGAQPYSLTAQQQHPIPATTYFYASPPPGYQASGISSTLHTHTVQPASSSSSGTCIFQT